METVNFTDEIVNTTDGIVNTTDGIVNFADGIVNTTDGNSSNLSGGLLDGRTSASLTLTSLVSAWPGLKIMSARLQDASPVTRYTWQASRQMPGARKEAK